MLVACVGTLKAVSGIYETTPWGIKEQDLFLNQAVLLQSVLSCQEALKQALKIQYGKNIDKKEKYGPRVLDIDLVLCGQCVIHEREITVPHPRMHKRNFVLIPLAEIAGDVIHPLYGKSVRQLILECPDEGKVRLYKQDGDRISA